MGTADGYQRYASANQQVKYAAGATFQVAQLQFLKDQFDLVSRSRVNLKRDLGPIGRLVRPTAGLVD